MEILFSITSFLLFILLIFSPIVIFKKLKQSNFKFLRYLTLGLMITFIIILIMAWLSSESTEILLSRNGYNFDAMNDEERFANVAKENLEKVKTLEISKNGIGWPAKVMFIYPFNFLYILLVYLVMNLIRKRK